MKKDTRQSRDCRTRFLQESVADLLRDAENIHEVLICFRYDILTQETYMQSLRRCTVVKIMYNKPTITFTFISLVFFLNQQAIFQILLSGILSNPRISSSFPKILGIYSPFFSYLVIHGFSKIGNLKTRNKPTLSSLSTDPRSLKDRQSQNSEYSYLRFLTHRYKVPQRSETSHSPIQGFIKIGNPKTLKYTHPHFAIHRSKVPQKSEARKL